MNQLRIAFAGLASALLLGSCGGTTTKVEPTSIVVRIDAEPGVRAVAPVLRVVVYGGTSPDPTEVVGTELWRMDGSDGHRYPVDFVVAPKDGDASRTFRVEATAMDGDGVTARAGASVRGSYVAGATKYVELDIQASCLNAASCNASQTCRSGTCVDSHVAPSALSALPQGGLARTCATDNGGCDPNVHCTEQNDASGTKTVTCGDCPHGFEGLGELACVNIDDCPGHACDPLTVCVDGIDSATCSSCPLGFEGTGETGCSLFEEATTSATCLMNDADSMTYTFVIDALQVPDETPQLALDGLDLDGVHSTPDTSAIGCFHEDHAERQGGLERIDDEFATAMEFASRAAVPDALWTFFANIVASARSDGGQIPKTQFRVTLSKWNGTLTDACVGVLLEEAGAPGTPWAPVGSATPVASQLRNGISPRIALQGAAHIHYQMTTKDPCTPGTHAAGRCGGAAYDCVADTSITLDDAFIRLHVESIPAGGFRLLTRRPWDAASVLVSDPTLIAGAIHFWDTSSMQPACQGSVPAAATYQSALYNAMCELGMDGSKWINACSLFAQALDLRAVSGQYVACEGTAWDSSRANAMSAAFYLGSSTY